MIKKEEKTPCKMERRIIRILIVVALVFFLAGDFATLLTSTLNTIGLSPGSMSTKRPGEKFTGKRKPVTTDYELDDDDDESLDILGTSSNGKLTLMATIRNSCLPKLICELNATPHRERLTESEKSLLSLIRDTSISMTAEVTSKYHFAAHMGQLIAGIEGTGCHNFYPGCPFPGLQVLQMMKKVKIR